MAHAQTHNWAGAYAGINAGYARGQSDARTTVDNCPVNGFLCTTVAPLPTNLADIGSKGSGSLSDGAAIAGGQVGYNFQSGTIVAGLTADLDAFKLGASRSVGPTPYVTNPVFAYSIGSSVQTSWLSTLRARAGFTLGNVLVYGTGGVALTRIEVSNFMRDNFVNGGFAGSSSSSKTKLGWAAGAGFEVGLDGRWSLGGEYLHVDLASVRTSALGSYLGGTNVNPFSTRHDLRADLFRAMLNYRF